MNTENLNKKIASKIADQWPRVRSIVAQLTFEGAYWYDEGTHVALMVWNKYTECETVAMTMAFDSDGNLEDVEECFDVEALIMDEGY